MFFGTHHSSVLHRELLSHAEQSSVFQRISHSPRGLINPPDDSLALLSSLGLSEVTSRTLSLCTNRFVLWQTTRCFFPLSSSSLIGKSVRISLFCFRYFTTSTFSVRYFATSIFCIRYFATSIFFFRYFATSIFCLSTFYHFDILPLRYFAFDILPLDILHLRYLAFPYFAFSIFCNSIFCNFDILPHRYFAHSIFCDFDMLSFDIFLSIFCDSIFCDSIFCPWSVCTMYVCTMCSGHTNWVKTYIIRSVLTLKIIALPLFVKSYSRKLFRLKNVFFFQLWWPV